jgi:hypothetical protein
MHGDGGPQDGNPAANPFVGFIFFAETKLGYTDRKPFAVHIAAHTYNIATATPGHNSC